jgi:hypothetical protein
MFPLQHPRGRDRRACDLSRCAFRFGGARTTLCPERIGSETAHYHGSAAILLKTPSGLVEIRPMAVEKGQIRLAVAVYNQSGRAANFGTENISATINGLQVAVPSAAQLAQDAQRKARNAKIGTMLFAGAVAGSPRPRIMKAPIIAMSAGRTAATPRPSIGKTICPASSGRQLPSRAAQSMASTGSSTTRSTRSTARSCRRQPSIPKAAWAA